MNGINRWDQHSWLTETVDPKISTRIYIDKGGLIYATGVDSTATDFNSQRALESFGFPFAYLSKLGAFDIANWFFVKVLSGMGKANQIETNYLLNDLFKDSLEPEVGNYLFLAAPTSREGVHQLYSFGKILQHLNFSNVISINDRAAARVRNRRRV